MDINHLSSPGQLERNSFLWSEVRLVVAAVALFLGGVPPVVYFLDTSSAIWGLLRVAWLISGAASLYLALRWHQNGYRVFGGNDQKSTAAFVISILSGLNLGWAGLTDHNIGMSIASDQTIFTVVGVLYLLTAYYLYSRWNSRGQKLF